MKLNAHFAAEAPAVQICTDHEFRAALARVRELEAARIGTAEGLERSALEFAMAAYLTKRIDRSH